MALPRLIERWAELMGVRRSRVSTRFLGTNTLHLFISLHPQRRCSLWLMLWFPFLKAFLGRNSPVCLSYAGQEKTDPCHERYFNGSSVQTPKVRCTSGYSIFPTFCSFIILSKYFEFACIRTIKSCRLVENPKKSNCTFRYSVTRPPKGRGSRSEYRGWSEASRSAWYYLDWVLESSKVGDRRERCSSQGFCPVFSTYRFYGRR